MFRNPLIVHFLFLTAGLVCVSLDPILYRVGMVIILAILRTAWIMAFASRMQQSARQQTLEEVLELAESDATSS